MAFRFLLITGEVYEFKGFNGYSRLLDSGSNLYQVPDTFTLEDIETAQKEFNKYVGLKEALEDIVKNRKLWSKEELVEFCKYNLDSPVLEWLEVKETPEEKELREFIMLDSEEYYEYSEEEDEKVKKLKTDSIILNYIIPDKLESSFIFACKNGFTKVAKWLYMVHNPLDFNTTISDIPLLRLSFYLACSNGYLELAQWIYEISKPFEILIPGYLRPERIITKYELKQSMSFSCIKGQLGVVQWLYSLIQPIEQHVLQLLFDDSIENLHLELAQWIYSICDFKLTCRACHIYSEACERGQLELAEWVKSNFCILI